MSRSSPARSRPGHVAPALALVFLLQSSGEPRAQSVPATRANCEKACAQTNEVIKDFSPRTGTCTCGCKTGWARLAPNAACQDVSATRAKWRRWWVQLRKVKPDTCLSCGQWAMRNLGPARDNSTVPRFVGAYIQEACLLFDDCVASLPASARNGRCRETCGDMICNRALRGYMGQKPSAGDENLRAVLQSTLGSPPADCSGP